MLYGPRYYANDTTSSCMESIEKIQVSGKILTGLYA